MGGLCSTGQSSGGGTRSQHKMAREAVLAAHNGDTERLRALLEANPNLVDAVR